MVANYEAAAGVYIMFDSPRAGGGGGAKIRPTNMFGKKIIERGWKRGGECIICPQL